MNISSLETAIRSHFLSGMKVVITSGLALLTSSVMASEVKNIKVETVNARSGCVASATVKQMDDKVYVSGRVRVNQPFQPSAGAHVDVYLVDAMGRPLGRRKNQILVTSQKHDRTRGDLFPYAVSFDHTTAANAVTARVVYCPGAHRDQS